MQFASLMSISFLRFGRFLVCIALFSLLCHLKECAQRGIVPGTFRRKILNAIRYVFLVVGKNVM